MSRWVYERALGTTLRAAILISLGYAVPTMLQTRAGDKTQQVDASEQSHSLDESVRILFQQNKAAPDISNAFVSQELRMPPDNSLGNFIVEFYPEGYFDINTEVPMPLTVGYVAQAYNSKVKIVNPPNPYDRIEIDNFLRGNDFDAIRLAPQFYILEGIKYRYDTNNKHLLSAIIRGNKKDGVDPLLIIEAMKSIANKIAKKLVEAPPQTGNNNNGRVYNQSLAFKNNLKRY